MKARPTLALPSLFRVQAAVPIRPTAPQAGLKSVLGALQSLTLRQTSKPSVVLSSTPGFVGAQEPPVTGEALATSLTSSAKASGLALNGGKASAHASAMAKPGSAMQAVSEADALANRAAVSKAKASAQANSKGHDGTGLAKASATALADQNSLAIAKGGANSIGLAGHLSQAVITSRSAATDNSVSLVGGTAVAISGPNSDAATTSSATGAAANKAVAKTRADSISIGFVDSGAVGSATSNAQATNHGLAASQSLMESFAVGGTGSTASSVANATAAGAGVSMVRDKAATLGFAGSNVSSITSSQGTSAVLGFSVIESVARAITANSQKVCADAVTKAYSDLATGAQVSLDTFLLALKQRADQQCVSSFKDLAAKAAGQKLAMGVSSSSKPAAAHGLPSFEGIKAELAAGTQGVLDAAAKAVDQVERFVDAGPIGTPVQVSRATWGRMGHRRRL